MNIHKHRIVLSVIMAVLLAGCSQKSFNETVSEPASDNTITVTESDTESAYEPETEVSYMEKCSNMIVEMPPDDILAERDGISYPYFEKFTYYSSTAERDTPVNVLLPEGYTADRKYPVLYILHGYYDNEDWMARDIVHISTMLTNLIHDGEAKEMIVVCPYIYCSKDMQYVTGMDDQNTLNYDNFINDMMTDLMPFIEENFSVASGRENTAITGFSMGGRESLFIGVSHPEIFGYIASACSAPGLTEGTGYPWMLKEDELTFADTKPYLLMISASQKDGVVGTNPLKYRTIFEKNGNEILWHSMSNTGHDHTSVTPHLYNYMRMIFKGE